MILHPDGRVEGTVEEIMAYAAKRDAHPTKFIDPQKPKTAATIGNPLMPWITTSETRISDHVIKKQHDNGNITYLFV